MSACIESVLDQDLAGSAVEVIAIDDASSDGSWSALQRYAGTPGVRLLREEGNRGYVATYRRGMAMARGRYLVPLDADDLILERDALTRQVEIAERHRGVGLVHSHTQDIDHAGRPLRVRAGWSEDGIVPSAVAFQRLLMGNSIQHTGTLMRREAYEAVGGYDASLVNSIDWDLWLRIARTWDVGHIRRALYAYRLHGRNMHQRVARSDDGGQTVRREIFSVLDRATSDVPARRRALAIAQAHLVMANALFNDVSRGLGWHHLWRAVRHSPAVVGGRLFWEAALRGIIVSLVGGRGIDAIRSRLRRSR